MSEYDTLNRAVELLEVAGYLGAAKELRQLTELLYAQDNALTWETTCLNCASLMDKNYEQYVEIKRLKGLRSDDVKSNLLHDIADLLEENRSLKARLERDELDFPEERL